MEFPDKLGVSRQTRPNSIQTFKIDDVLLELFLSLYLALKMDARGTGIKM